MARIYEKLDIDPHGLFEKINKYLFSKHYSLDRNLQTSEYSETWLARKSYSRQQVVVKFPTLEICQSQDYLLYKNFFEQEGHVLIACQHDHIVKLIDQFTLDSPDYIHRPCIVMEYIAGKTLKARVGDTKTGISLNEALKYIEQIGAALRLVHYKNYLHHDIQPQNILIRDPKTTGGKCEAVLIDFGLARQFIPNLVRTYSQIPGSFTFAAPELERARQEQLTRLHTTGEVKGVRIQQTEAMDIYSLSATLFFMLTNRLPSINSLDLDLAIDIRVREAIKKGLEVSPSERPSSIAEWLSLLPLYYSPIYNINGVVDEYDLSSSSTWDVLHEKKRKAYRNPRINENNDSSDQKEEPVTSVNEKKTYTEPVIEWKLDGDFQPPETSSQVAANNNNLIEKDLSHPSQSSMWKITDNIPVPSEDDSSIQEKTHKVGDKFSDIPWKISSD